MNYIFFEYFLVIFNWNLGCCNGVLVLINQGKIMIYVIMGIEDWGMIFVDLGIEVYEGMIVG